jgi:hypothetical protein
MSATPTSTSFLGRLYKLLSSFGLATVVLSLLLIETFLGTLEQREHGLFDSQRKYFESLLITNIDVGCCVRAMHVPELKDSIGHFVLPILLPGGGLLMFLLAVNMICGGIARLTGHIIHRRKHGVPIMGHVGVLMAHVSVVFMLAAGLVSLWFKQEGAVRVVEGSKVNEFESFHRSVIQVEKLLPSPADGKRTALVIPDTQFADLTPGKQGGKARTFTSDKLPFDLVVMNYLTNSSVRRAKADESGDRVVDGFVLQEVADRDPETGKPVEHEQLYNGAYVKAIDKKTGAEQRGIIWRVQAAPWSVKIGDEVYGVSIGRRPLALPFTVKLDKFIREVHPGTEKARKFSSQVTVNRGGRDEGKLITMNEPLRYGGFAFFQSSFDMEAVLRGGPQASVFQVASNPSDHWPLIALLVAMAGLAINLVSHLLKFLSHSVGTKNPPPLPKS